MAISVLDVRDTLAPPPVRVPRAGAADVAGVPAERLRRVPLAALAGGLLAVLEAVALLATGLTQIDAVLSSPVRPPGLVVAGGLVALAGWIVLSAVGGAALLDGADRSLVVRTSLLELFVVAAAGAVAVVLPVPDALTPGLPLPVAFAVAVSLPVTKLLLVDAAPARRWVAQGPRVRRSRPDPVAGHRVLCTLTLGVIALGLAAVAVLAPVQDGVGAPASSVVYQP